MISRPTHSRVIMPAAITGRDSTARYSAMRGPTAAWRAMAQGGASILLSPIVAVLFLAGRDGHGFFCCRFIG